MEESRNYGEPVTINCNLGLPWLPKDFKVNETFDAQKWAASFLQTLREHPEITIDHDFMVAWFAYALMKGIQEYVYHDPQAAAAM